MAVRTTDVSARGRPDDARTMNGKGLSPMIDKKSLLGAVVISAALLAGVSAFTAANTVPETSAGQGADDITGYTISDVVYETADDSAQIIGASFTVTPDTSTVDATTVQARIVLDGVAAGDYTRCTLVPLTTQDWECDWSASPYDPADAVTLDVVAVQ